jgi:integrase
MWRVRVRRRGVGEFDKLYAQNVRESIGEVLDFLGRERATAIHDLRRDATRAKTGGFHDDVHVYLKRRASISDYTQRERNLRLWEGWLTGRLGAFFKTSAITPALVELALEEWKAETIAKKKSGGRRVKRWAAATLRARALHLSNLFVTLYPSLPNPVLAIKDRLPPKSAEVDKAQPLPVVTTLLESLRTPTVLRQKQHVSFSSIRVALLGLSGMTIQELWSLRDARAIDLRSGIVRIPAKRVVERYQSFNGRSVVCVATEQREARVIELSPDAWEAARIFVEYPPRYNGGTPLIKFGYFATGGLRNALRHAAFSAGLDYVPSPYEFGTAAAPTVEQVKSLVAAMKRDVLPYRPTADRSRTLHAWIRAQVLAFTGARVGELALLEPNDIRLQERVVMMPTEKHRRNAGRLERDVGRRRIPLNGHGVAALKLFIQHDLFDRVSDRSRVPDEKKIPWYQQFYHQVVWAARRVKDPYTGAPLYFTPHCFRHSFATALAPLIGGDAKTGAKIMGHSPQTFMRYVRANDETARAAVEKMMVGVGDPQPEAVESALRLVK